jgi:hypothetical protein
MVKARGYGLLPVTRLKSGVVLRDFGLITGISVSPKKSATDLGLRYLCILIIFKDEQDALQISINRHLI